MILYRLLRNHRFVDESSPVLPTIPYSRMTGEDESTPRICVAKSIDDCLTSIGFSSLCYKEVERTADDVTELPAVSTEDGSELNGMWRDLRFPFTLLSFEVADNDPDLISPEKLVSLVPDVSATGEYWITKPVQPSRVEHLWLFDAALDTVNFQIDGYQKSLVRVLGSRWTPNERPVTQNFANDILHVALA